MLDQPFEDVLGRALGLQRNLRRHRSTGPRTSQRDLERFEGPPHGIGHGGGLIAAVHHAVGALLVVARAVAIPVRRFHQIAERRGIALAEEVTRPLPAENVARGISPWGATILLVAGEKVEKQCRLAEPPAPFALTLEDLTKKLLCLRPVQKVVLIGCT